jgi:Rad3-related DNA helicase
VPQKWHELLSNLKRVSGWEARGLLSLIIWAEETHTGDVSENSSFSRKHYGALWKRLAADRHFCTGKRCPRHKECWLMDVRKRAEDAHIIIVNHSLLLADVSRGNTTLGEYDHLIIDEAHNLPDAASQHLALASRGQT